MKSKRCETQNNCLFKRSYFLLKTLSSCLHQCNRSIFLLLHTKDMICVCSYRYHVHMCVIITSNTHQRERLVTIVQSSSIRRWRHSFLRRRTLVEDVALHSAFRNRSISGLMTCDATPIRPSWCRIQDGCPVTKVCAEWPSKIEPLIEGHLLRYPGS